MFTFSFRAKFSYVFLCKEFLRKNNLGSSFSKNTAFFMFLSFSLYSL